MIDYITLSLGEIINEKYEQSFIEDAFKKFSCQREADLESFLCEKAIPYEKTDFGKTYLLVDNSLLKEGVFSVAAYFTIAQKSVDISKLSKKKKRKVLGDYPGRDGLNSVPAYLIGQLGRNDAYSHDLLSGQKLLEECYNAISIAAKVVGGRLLVLECREQMFEKFYESQGFLKLYDELSKEQLYTLYKKVNFSEYWNRKI